MSIFDENVKSNFIAILFTIFTDHNSPIFQHDFNNRVATIETAFRYFYVIVATN